ncbi:MAG: hypothetical protein C0602_13085 [Denitrovibrio sp.]|nr:MAG: hypothetical protein C0602_13085 [Denitrovibrio sp.]
MKLISLLLVLSLTFAVSCTTNENEDKHFRIGIIQYTNTNDMTRQGFVDGMSSYGYQDGSNTEYLYFGNAYSFEEINGILDRIIEMKPDLIYASTTPASLRAYQKTKNTGIPVVFGPVNDPVKAGIIKNIRAPGENITGVRLAPSDPKRLEWIKLIKPDAKNILLPYTKNDTSSNITVSLISKVSKGMGLNIIKHPVESKEDIYEMIENMPENIDAVFMPRDGLVMSAIKEFSKMCLEKKIILSSPRHEQVIQGATTGYGFIGYELGKQAARMADSILKGTPPGQVPVETAEDYLFINLDIVNSIDLKISDIILQQAYKAK